MGALALYLCSFCLLLKLKPMSLYCRIMGMFIFYRTGMRSWLHLQRREPHCVTKSLSFNTPRLSAILAGTHIFLLLVLLHFLTSLTSGSTKEKIFSTQVANVRKMPPVNTIPRYSPANTNRTHVYMKSNSCIQFLFPMKMLLLCIQILSCLVAGLGYFKPGGLCQPTVLEKRRTLGDICLCILSWVTVCFPKKLNIKSIIRKHNLFAAYSFMLQG